MAGPICCIYSDSDSDKPPMRWLTLNQLMRRSEEEKRRFATMENAEQRYNTGDGELSDERGVQTMEGGNAPPLEKAANPIVLESQEMFSTGNVEDAEAVRVDNPNVLVEKLRTQSTDNDNLEPLATRYLEFVPFTGEPFNDEEIREDLPRYFYFFLTSLNIQSLRSVAKDMMVKQGCHKNILLARVFLKFMRGYRMGEDEMGLILSPENEATFDYFKAKLAKDVINQEMPGIQYLNDAAHAQRSSEAPPPHKSMNTPPSDVPSGGVSRGRRNEVNVNSDVEVDAGNCPKKAKRKKSVSKTKTPFLRNLRPRRLFADERSTRAECRHAQDDRVREAGPSARGKGRKNMKGSRKSSPAASAVAGKKTPATDAEKGSAQIATEKEGSRGMNSSEFARLLVVLKDDEDCRASFLKSSQVLSRQQLDRGDRSGDFWTNVVEPTFNAKDNTVQKDCSPVLAGVDPSKPPATYKTGDQLSTQFKSFRSKFMTYLFKFNASGQNSPDFKTFVTEAGLSVDSILGQRIILGGFIFGVGTPNEDEAFLQSVCRTIGRAGVNGYDARMSQDEQESGMNNDALTTGTRKARTHYVNGIIQEKSLKALDALTTCAEKYDKIQTLRIAKRDDRRSEASPVVHQRSKPRTRGNGTPSRERDILLKDKLMTSQLDLLRSLGEACEGLRNCEGDDLMTGHFEDHIEMLTRYIEERRNILEEGM